MSSLSTSVMGALALLLAIVCCTLLPSVHGAPHGRNVHHFLELQTNTSCNADGPNYYVEAANGTCGNDVVCPLPDCVPMTCACLDEFRRCVEAAATVIHTNTSRDSCSPAQSIYNSLVAVIADTPFKTTPAGEACGTLSCKYELECPCDKPAFDETTPVPDTPVPGTPVPPVNNTPAPPTNSTPAPPTPTPNPPGVVEKPVVSLKINIDIANFDEGDFQARVAASVDVAADKVIIVSVKPGSVIVKFYFDVDETGSTNTSLSQALADKFVAEGWNSTIFSTAYEVLTPPTVAVETVTVPDPATPAPNTTAPQGSPAPASDGESSLSTGLIIAIVVAAIIVVGAVIVVITVCFCCKGKEAVKDAFSGVMGNEPAHDYDDQPMDEV